MLSIVPYDASLVNLIRLIILSHFANDNYCTVIYYDEILINGQNGCNIYCQYFAALERSFEDSTRHMSVMWIAAGSGTEESHIENAVEEGCQSYITVTHNIMDFLALKLLVKEKTEQRARDKNFLMFSGNEIALDDIAIVREALKFYPNLWFMVPSGDSGYDFYSQDYSSSDRMDVPLVTSFLYEEKNFTNERSLFYDKLLNMQGRTIPMGVAEYSPYCTTHYVGANKGNADAFNSSFPKLLFIEGTEGSLIIEFCKIRNCSITLWPFGPSEWGDIFSNGSGYGEIYSSYSKRTDFSICCLYQNWFNNFLDASQYIAKSTVVLLVPGAKLLPTFYTPMYPFSTILWQTIFVMQAIMTVVHHVVTILNARNSLLRSSRLPSIEKSMFDMISIYLDQGFYPNSKTSSYRVFIAFILLSGVVLSNSYSGGLASVLTVPKYEKSLETIHDYVQTPYRWAAPAIAWVLSLYGAESHEIQTVLKRFDLISDENQLYESTLNHDFGVGLEALNSGSYTFGSYVREDNVRTFDILKEELYFGYTAGYAQRGWPMMEKFNKFILETIQHGFVIHWEERTLRKYHSNRVEQALLQISTGYKQEEVLQALSVQHILGAIFILLIGAVTALIIFICEVIWKTSHVIFGRITTT